MRAIIAAGGTAGHINPAIAIARELTRNTPESDILFIGRQDGMEAGLVAEAGYPFRHIEVHGFDRVWTLKAAWFNVKCIWYALRASGIARKLLKEFKPDVVIGCGGYVSGPVVRIAAKMGIRTAIHEQNAFPGITTRILANYADVVLIPNHDAAQYLPKNSRCIVVGNPIRPEFLTADRVEARKRLGVADKICVVSFGGSLGARTINQIAVAFMALHAGSHKVFHIHATGKYGKKTVSEGMSRYGLNTKHPEIHVVEYITDMADCFAAADLIISRAGAVTISELAAVGRASVLIPSPNVAENHQYYNAMTLKKLDAALLFEEKDVEVDKTAHILWELVQNRQKLETMGANAKQAAIPDSAKKVVAQILQLVREGGEIY